MAQVKLLKISSEGVPQEFNSTSDEITLASFTVQGGGPVLSGTGLDMNLLNITDVPEVHSASTLLLVADSGDVDVKSSSGIVHFKDGAAVDYLSFTKSVGIAAIEAPLLDLELKSGTSMKLYPGNDVITVVDSGLASQFEIDVGGGKASLVSVAGDLELDSATGLVKLLNAGAEEARLDTSATGLLIDSNQSIDFKTTTDAVNFQDSTGAVQASLETDIGGSRVLFYSSNWAMELESASTMTVRSIGAPVQLESGNDTFEFNSAGPAQALILDISGPADFQTVNSKDIKFSPDTFVVDASGNQFKTASILFDNPAAGTINQTAGSLIVDNIMAKERDNVMTTAGAVIFPSISNAGGEVDSFRLPYLAGAPSASPSYDVNPGYMVYDSTNKNLYIWDGSAWDNQSTVSSAQSLDLTFVAGEALTAGDAIYIDAAGQAFKADNDSGAASEAIGFALSSVLAAASVQVRVGGKVSGFVGLTAGARYYIGESGAITSTVPAASGEYIVQMGYAVSATEVVVQVLQLGRRA